MESVVDLPGVLLTPLKIIPSKLGAVFHALKASDPGYAGFGEAYFSSVLPGSIKGWKRHREMTLNLVVPVGEIEFQLFDSRSGPGRTRAVTLSPTNYARLTVPPGIWVAFKGGSGSTENILCNVANREHDPHEAEALEYPGLELGMPAVAWRKNAKE